MRLSRRRIPATNLLKRPLSPGSAPGDGCHPLDLAVDQQRSRGSVGTQHVAVRFAARLDQFEERAPVGETHDAVLVQALRRRAATRARVEDDLALAIARARAVAP